MLASSSAAADPDAGVPDTWLGVWVLNVARSDYGPAPAPYKRATYRIERSGDGFRVIYDMVHPRGGTTHLEWTGRMDGRDYALQGVDQAITYAYTAADAAAGDVVVKIDGRVAARSRVTVSPDGRTMTTSTTSAGPGGQRVVSTTVYEKQPVAIPGS
jgi:hypothetical protein